MYPDILFTVFGKPITLYVVVYVVGLAPAIGLGLWLAHRRGVPVQLGLDGAIMALAGAWAGSRLLSALQYYFSPSEGVGQRLTDLLREGGQASMGGLLGLLLGLLLFFHFSPRIKAGLPAMDVVVPGVALYQGIARLGCFAAGCCHGTPVAGSAWSVTFTDPLSACRYLNLPVHPAQLYLAGANLLLAAGLVWMALAPSRFRGYLLAAYFVGYGMVRFAVEFVRGDPRPFLGPLSLNQ